jgi:nucleoside-diphosphate-sugar epimerase
MDNLKNKRILITGGSGYLGSHLTDTLKNICMNVYTIDLKTNNYSNEYLVDLLNDHDLKEVVNEIKPHIIYHLAAVLNRERSYEHHDHIMQVNYFGTIKLLKALQNIKYDNFIFASTSEIYGNNPPPFHEMQIPDPVSPYSLSKSFSELAIKSFSNIYNKSFTIMRMFNFFGKNMPDNFFISQLLTAQKNNIPFKMTGGEQIRDYLYIDDVISALVLAATNENSKNEIFNVCSGKGFALKVIANEITSKIKSDFIVSFGAIPYRKNEIWNMVGDNSKIKRILGFYPKYNLPEAIEFII